MTDREAAAGLVDRLEKLAGLTSDDPEMDRAGEILLATIAHIKAQASELERVGKELRIVQNAAKTLASAQDTELQHRRQNHAYDHHLRAEHESMQERDALMTELLEAAEARALKAEKERDNLKLQAQGHAMEARSANATIYDAYQAVTGATGEPGNWNGAETIKAELDRLRALVAEAEGLLRRLKHRIVYQVMNSHDPDALAIEAFLNRERSDLRAARAFIEKAKS